MEIQTKILPPEVLLEDYCRLLQTDEDIAALPLQVSGNSMFPFLTHGRDTVFFSRLTRPARRGDVLLYRRDSGAYVLHRVLAVGEGSLTMLGDSQLSPEPGIRPEQVLAVTEQVIRKGKILRAGDPAWEFFAKTWLKLYPVRPWALAVARRLKI